VTDRKADVATVEVTGMVGGAVFSILEERRFSVSTVRARTSRHLWRAYSGVFSILAGSICGLRPIMWERVRHLTLFRLLKFWRKTTC